MALFRISSNQIPYQIPQKDFESKKYEENLEEWIEKCPEILSDAESFLIIGRQVTTAYGKIIDLLALDQSGNTVIIELKRGRTPREIIAQALEYTSWVSTLQETDLEKIASIYLARKESDFKSLKHSFSDFFKIEEKSATFNSSQRIIIISQEITPEIALTAKYHNIKGFDITLMTFSYFEQNHEEILETDVVLKNEKKSFVHKQSSRHSDFFNDVEKNIRSKLTGDLAQIKSYQSPIYLQYWYPGTKKQHFEIWFRRQRKLPELIEIGLHLEPADGGIFEYLKDHENQIKDRLGHEVKIEPWGKKWGRVYEQWNSETTSTDKAANRLLQYIQVLFPLLKIHNQQ